MKWKFGITTISNKKVIITSVLQDFEQKTTFFWEVVLVQIHWFGTGSRFKTGSGIKVLRQCRTELKLKVRKILGLIPSFVEVAFEKLIRGSFAHPLPPSPSWIGLKSSSTTNIWNSSTFFFKSNSKILLWIVF